MKKKLEAELISIAHRILKLKNRAHIDQLQAETLKLYEKLSVLKFVEEHFNGAEPTIGHASAVFSLEEIYDLKEEPVVHGNVVEAEEEKARAEKKAEPKKENEDKENAGGEGVDTDGDGKAPVADAEAPSPKGEQHEAASDDKNEAPDTEENIAEEAAPEPEAVEEAETALEEEKEEAQPEVKEETEAHPETKSQPQAEVQDKENGTGEGIDLPSGKPAVSQEEKKYTEEAAKPGFEFGFDRAEAPVKQKEISFEDFHDYKEPEFVKKSPLTPKGVEEPGKAEPEPADDWRNWEPAKTAATDQPKAVEQKAEEPKPAEPVRDWRDWEPAKAEPTKPVEAPKPAETPKPVNTGLGRSISLGLNDRIAFEKNLFGGSADDLNRVISQLNTLNSYDEARNFIDDLVKPDYANWAGKEEYEERFMALVEKRFS